MTKKPPPCPECGADKTIPIAYGLPSKELRREVEEGKVHLGGCLVTGDDPKWYCPICKHEWRS